MTHKILLGILGVSVLLLSVPIGMRIVVGSFIYSNVATAPEAHMALVLGASVARGVPRPILAQRANTAIALYSQSKVQKILVSGDSDARSHDEVIPVFEYLLAAGIPAEGIFLDRAGFDTYSSMYRAREVFQAQSLIIVTQDFHMPRALWVARQLGLDAHGVLSGTGGSIYDYLREIPASIKAFFDTYTERQPKYLGPTLPLKGREVTWD